MAPAQEIRVRLALVGPPGSGKSAALEAFHRLLDPQVRGPLTRFPGPDGSTLLYDHTEFELGRVGDTPLVVDLYALPGDPDAVLARRIVLAGCNGFLFAVDARTPRFEEARSGFLDLLEYLEERGRTAETAALVGLVTRKEGARPEPGRPERLLAERLGDRLLHVNSRSGEGMAEAVRKATALVLAREKEALEARRAGAPPPRFPAPPELEAMVEQAHQLYLRASSQTNWSTFSPHSDAFLGQVLVELGAMEPDSLETALQLQGEARALKLGVTLADIVTKRGLADPELLPQARRLRGCVEVIHEELLFGKLASKLDLIPFVRVKQGLTLQSRRAFQLSLDHILTRAGHLDRAARVRVLEELARAHQEELARDEALLQAPPKEGSRVFDTRSFSMTPLFGEAALNLGLITREQLSECLSEQRALKKAGKNRFIGAILRSRGYLREDEIPLVCKALEKHLSRDSIPGYEILRYLGRGNMALVYAARQVNLDRVVALKVLDPKLLFKEGFLDRFIQEARAAARLNHPNIVQAYDVGTARDLHYFAMEYVDGITASELAEDAGGTLDEQTAMDVVVQVARALEHAARNQLVHRDVKPGNVMVNRDGVVKLCDLGLAKLLDAEVAGEEGVILGSPYYIAPEQIEGRADIDTRADIYSLGAMFFHLVAGRPPFTGRTPEDVCIKHLSEPVPNPADLNPSVTQRIVPILIKMMAKDRRARFESCGEVVRAITRIHHEAASDERQAALAVRVGERFPARPPA